MEEESDKLDEVIELLGDIVQNREYIIRKYSEREINQIEVTGSQPVTYGSEWKIIYNESKFSCGMERRIIKMYKCFVCEKEVKDNEEFDWFGLDGDKIHKKCKPNVEKKIEIIDNMSDKEFGDYLTGKTDIEI